MAIFFSFIGIQTKLILPHPLCNVFPSVFKSLHSIIVVQFDYTAATTILKNTVKFYKELHPLFEIFLSRPVSN